MPESKALMQGKEVNRKIISYIDKKKMIGAIDLSVPLISSCLQTRPADRIE